jgi:hypothetical protein
LDFTIADGVSDEGGNPVGEHPDLITDVNGHRSDFIDILASFVDYYRNESAIWAWDLMNEPEVILDQAYPGVPSVSDLQTFFTELAGDIHTIDPTLEVTIGSMNRDGLSNWTGANEVGLDIIQFHYYNKWQTDGNNTIDFDAPDFGGRPVIVGEVDPSTCEQDGQQNDSYMTIYEKLDTINNRQYDGVLIWQEESGVYAVSEQITEDINSWFFGAEDLQNLAGGDTRRVDLIGDIYEYASGSTLTQLWYDKSQMTYSRYTWDTINREVTINVFQAVYDPVSGSAIFSDLQPNERIATYEYSYPSGADLDYIDPRTNGWTLTKETLYESNGTDIKEEYIYNTSGQLTQSYHNDTAAGEFIGCDYASNGKISNVYTTSGAIVSYHYTTDTGATSDRGLIEYYQTGYAKRKIQEAGFIAGALRTTWNIVEYEDGGYYIPDEGSQEYGRLSLVFNNYLYDNNIVPTYYTYDWETFQVTVNEYDGIYTPIPGSALRSGVSQDELRFTYLYVHNGNESNVDTSQNGWDLIKKTVYENDGLTLKEEYAYYQASGLLKTKTLATPDADGNIYFKYEDNPFYNNGTLSDTSDDYGRIEEIHLVEPNDTGEVAFKYNYYASTPGAVETIEAYSDTACTTLVATYEYDMYGYTPDPNRTGPYVGRLIAKNIEGGKYYVYSWNDPASGEMLMNEYADDTQAVLLRDYAYTYTDSGNGGDWTLNRLTRYDTFGFPESHLDIQTRYTSGSVETADEYIYEGMPPTAVYYATYSYDYAVNNNTFGQLRSMISGDIVVTYSWDDPVVGQVTGVEVNSTDPLDIITTTYIWEYSQDAQGNYIIGHMLSKEVAGSNIRTTYIWDTIGGTITGTQEDITDPLNPIRQAEYVWELTQNLDGDDVFGQLQTKTEYDATGTIATDQVTGVEVDTTDPLNPITTTYVWEYLVDTGGNVVIGHMLSKEIAGTNVKTTYVWDDILGTITGLQEDVTDPLNPITEVVYVWELTQNIDGIDVFGELQTKTEYDATGTTVVKLTTYTWDFPALDQVTGVEVDITNPLDPITTTYIWEYSQDVDGNAVIGHMLSKERNGVTTTYSWDDPVVGQVTGTEMPSGIVYVWTIVLDTGGNEVVGVLISKTDGDIVTTYTWDNPVPGQVTGVEVDSTDPLDIITTTYVWEYAPDTEGNNIIGHMLSKEVAGTNVRITYVWDTIGGTITGTQEDITDPLDPIRQAEYVWELTQNLDGDDVFGQLQTKTEYDATGTIASRSRYDGST